jgi:hypothetical protein
MPNRRNDGRPVVGPADPETQRRMREQYDSDAKAENASRRARAAAPTPAAPVDPQGFVNKTTGGLNTRGQRIDQLVDDAVKGT